MFTDIMIKVAIILLCAGIAFLGLHLYLAYGADADYCSLWAREQTRIDITTAGDFTTLTSTQEMILKQKAKNLLFCKSVETRPQLEGDITILSDEAWSLSVYQLLIAKAQTFSESQGIEPATATPNIIMGDETWKEQCRAEYVSWDESTGTVIRKGSPERVKCPCGREVQCGQ